MLTVTPPAARQILHRRPYGRHEHLITPTMWRYMLTQAAYQIAVLFFLLYGLPSVMPGRYGTAVDPEHKRSLSLLFNSFIFMQVRGFTIVAVGTAHRWSRALPYTPAPQTVRVVQHKCGATLAHQGSPS